MSELRKNYYQLGIQYRFYLQFSGKGYPTEIARHYAGLYTDVMMEIGRRGWEGE